MTQVTTLKHRSELRRAGICIVCHENPAGLTRYGHRSVRCNECREKLPSVPKRQHKTREPRKDRPKAGEDWHGAESFYESKEFAKYCVLVGETAKSIRGEFTHRQIRETLGESCLGHEATIEALNRLTNAGELDRTREVLISKWKHLKTARKQRQVPAKKWNGGGDMGPSGHPRPDSDSIYGDR